MNADNCSSRSNESMLGQMTATRNVINNKFRKACAIRIEHERDANRTLQTLATASAAAAKVTVRTNDSESKKRASDYSLRKQTKNSTPQLALAINDPNVLCSKLRILINLQNVDSVSRTKEISSVVNKLHELGIII